MFPARSTLGSEAAQINQLIATVRRRSLAIDALKYLALLSCAVFGVAIVCLLFGTDVFPAALVYLVLLALFVVWVVVVRRARKSPSVVARTVDDKLALQDTLSTAYFLLNEPSQKPGPWDSVPVKQAADLASGIQPRQAFPSRASAGGLLLLHLLSLPSAFLSRVTCSSRRSVCALL